MPAPKVAAAETTTANDIALSVAQNETQSLKREILQSPLTSEVVVLSDVPDKVFAPADAE